MDKVSGVLIMGIVLIMITCGSVVYKRWIDNEVKYEVVVIRCDTIDEFKIGMQGFEQIYLSENK